MCLGAASSRVWCTSERRRKGCEGGSRACGEPQTLYRSMGPATFTSGLGKRLRASVRFASLGAPKVEVERTESPTESYHDVGRTVLTCAVLDGQLTCGGASA